MRSISTSHAHLDRPIFPAHAPRRSTKPCVGSGTESVAVVNDHSVFINGDGDHAHLAAVVSASLWTGRWRVHVLDFDQCAVDWSGYPRGDHLNGMTRTDAEAIAFDWVRGHLPRAEVDARTRAATR